MLYYYIITIAAAAAAARRPYSDAFVCTRDARIPAAAAAVAAAVTGKALHFPFASRSRA